MVGPDEASRDQVARLLPDPADVIARGVSDSVSALEAFRPDVVLIFGSEEGQLGTCLAASGAMREEPPIVVVVAGTPELAATALAGGADEVLLGTDSTALNERRLARMLEVLACRRRDALARRVVESLECGIVVTDATMTGHPVLLINPSWERMTGRDRTAILGQDASALAGPTTEPSV
ncbi:hypothetical protein EG835_07040, partial [bacterium]|nr:hypothetical protein [bacterium]